MSHCFLVRTIEAKIRLTTYVSLPASVSEDWSTDDSTRTLVEEKDNSASAASDTIWSA
jgi:hypothetical protein